MSIPIELLVALKTLDDESIGDFIYNIREKEGLGWDGPRVAAWGKACTVIREIVASESIYLPEDVP